MPTIKEYREFFLRNTRLNSGSKRDQEIGFLVSYIVKGVSVFNRFLKDHIPNENVFRKLFESITFKLNPEDTASATVQGLVKLTDDADLLNQVIPADGFSRTIQAYQLPEVVAGTLTGGTITITPSLYTIPASGGKKRKRYTIDLSVVANPVAPKIILLYSDPAVVQNGTISSATTTDQKTYAMPAGTLGTNNDYLEIEAVFENVAGVLFGAALILGTTTIAAVASVSTDYIKIRVKIIRRGVTSQLAEMEGYVGSIATNNKQAVGFLTFPTENLTNGLNIKASIVSLGATAANAIKCHSLIVKQFKV